jgi:hypothetical protein
MSEQREELEKDYRYAQKNVVEFDQKLVAVKCNNSKNGTDEYDHVRTNAEERATFLCDQECVHANERSYAYPKKIQKCFRRLGREHARTIARKASASHIVKIFGRIEEINSRTPYSNMVRTAMATSSGAGI